MTSRPKPHNHSIEQDRHSQQSPRYSGQAFSHAREEKQQHRKRKALKNHLVASTGEFVGTFMFLYFAFTAHLMFADQASDVATSNRGVSSQTVVFISLGYGFSLLITAWGWYRVSGGVFNPAVSSLFFFFVTELIAAVGYARLGLGRCPSMVSRARATPSSASWRYGGGGSCLCHVSR